ncbi:MAG: RIP metalloprotease RseP [Calditrichae bacterium]|nr:RIP metalloprotease RseP [Calditrichota bacterium]MCB9057164.1 RIP metalloprotease RseP [Calditrichia bacterium]
MSLLSIVAIIFAFSVLVLIHELGHYLAARWMGVRVEKFSIGFPPTLFSKKIGDTEFCFSAIPLGGYVKMAGFIDESMDTKVTGAEDEYSSKPVWKRIVIITAGVVMNILLAMGIYTFLKYSVGETLTPTTTVAVTNQSGIAEKIGFIDGDKVLKINGHEVSSWEDIKLDFFENMENGVDFQVLRNDKVISLHYNKEWLSEKNGEYLDLRPLSSSRIGEVNADMPAGMLGLKEGDLITELNGIHIDNWDEMSEIIRANPGKEVDIKWQNGGGTFSGTITPQPINVTDKDGKESSYGIIGVRNFTIHKPVSFFKALKTGIAEPYNIIMLNIKGLKWWISGVKSADETIGGPVMIAKLAGEAAELGWVTYLSLIAALSSVLAFFNILPIPALDGGHLSFLLVEAVMGRPLSVKKRLLIQQVGMAILLTFIVFVLYIDLNRMFF